MYPTTLNPDFLVVHTITLDGKVNSLTVSRAIFGTRGVIDVSHNQAVLKNILRDQLQKNLSRSCIDLKIEVVFVK